MIITFLKLNSPFAGQDEGTFFIRNSETSKFYTLSDKRYEFDPKLIEDNRDFFEEEVLNTPFEEGYDIFFLSIFGDVKVDTFIADKHMRLILRGNAFTTQEKAEDKILEWEAIFLKQND